MNTHRGPITSAKLDANRVAKLPTQEEKEQATREFPDNPMQAAMRADELAYLRRWSKTT